MEKLSSGNKDLYKRQKVKVRTGGHEGRHRWPRIAQKVVKGKTSYELGWKVNVSLKISIYIYKHCIYVIYLVMKYIPGTRYTKSLRVGLDRKYDVEHIYIYINSIYILYRVPGT